MNSSKWTWLFSLALVAAFAAPSLAEGEGKKDWNKEHPRRHEVNKRLKNQNKRAKEGVEDGKLTKDQAAQIRKEERRDAAKHGGHITKKEQNKINRQENRVSGQINKDEAGNAAPAPAAPAPAQ